MFFQRAQLYRTHWAVLLEIYFCLESLFQGPDREHVVLRIHHISYSFREEYKRMLVKSDTYIYFFDMCIV